MSRKEEIKELFTFTSGERKGLKVLIIILLIVIGIYFYLKITPLPEPKKDEQFKKEVAEFINGLTPLQGENSDSRLDKYIEDRYDSLELFKFDPNKTSETQWELLGLTSKQIATIQKYLQNGGRFFEKDDFRKIYGIRQRQYEILKPYIDLPDNNNYQNKYNYSEYQDTKSKLNKNDTSLYFNPNKSTQENWMKLGFSEKQTSVILGYFNKGGKINKIEDLQNIYCINHEKYIEIKDFVKIPDTKAQVESQSNPQVDINLLSEAEFMKMGTFWKYNAKKIVKYRNMLGGFYKKEQLLEIYGMKKEYYDKIEKDIIISLKNIKKLNINFIDEEELSKHPYFRYNIAHSIIEYRNKNGPYKSISELRDKKLISKTTLEKAKVYLTVK